MHDEGLRVLPKVIEAAGIADCILVGHSDGGSISMIYAGGTKTTATRGLIAIAPHVFCQELTLRSIAAAKQAYQTGDLRSKLEKHHGANTDCAFHGWNDVWLNPAFGDWNIEEFVVGIPVPILIIQGENDEYGTTAQVDAIHHYSRQPIQVSMISDCGHSPFREHKSQVLDLRARFVENVR
jgi:pimeloyl-ACP methyl ester carboxylesterase